MTYLNERLLSINDNNIARFTMDIQLSDNIIRTKEGYIRCENVTMGRTGYQTYLGRELTGMGFNATEIVEVFRDESEVFHEDTLNSAIGKPVTLGHPSVDVDINNIKDLGKGYILGKPKRVGDDMVGDILITDIDLIDAVWNKRLRELSLGYETKLVKDELGVRQTEIYINHLAVVENGRAGNAMIIDQQTIERGGSNLDLDKLKEQGIHIHINLNDLKKEEEKDEDKKKDEEVKEETVETKKVEDKEEVEVKADKDLDDKDEDEVEDKEEDEDKDKKEDKENVKDMEIKDLIEALNKLSPEEQAKLKDSLVVKTNDEKPEANAFNDVTQVSNQVGKVDIKDYSGVTGNEMSEALQKYHDDNFSFRAIRSRSGNNSLKAREVLYDVKDKEGRDFIKTGGNK